jgi:hypothetical protein
MISDEHKAVFVHIPKTGGSTIESILFKNNFRANGDNKSWNNDNCIEDPTKWIPKHTRANELPSKYQKYFSFTFVRNPWDLMVSCYFWWTQRTLSKHALKSRTEFGKYLKEKGFDYFIRSKQSSCINECCHINQGQSYWINNKIDFIGRFENLQEDFNIACDKIGIPQRELPHKNKTKHKHYTEYYDEETKSIVAEKYAKDIEYFGYKFGE